MSRLHSFLAVATFVVMSASFAILALPSPLLADGPGCGENMCDPSGEFFADYWNEVHEGCNYECSVSSCTYINKWNCSASYTCESETCELIDGGGT